MNLCIYHILSLLCAVFEIDPWALRWWLWWTFIIHDWVIKGISLFELYLVLPQEEASLKVLSIALIYEYRNTSFYCFFIRNKSNITSFYVYEVYLFSGSWLLYQYQLCVLCHRVDFKSSLKDKWLVTPVTFVSLLYHCILQAHQYFRLQGLIHFPL